MKEETKKKFKKIFSVTGVILGGAAIGAGAVIIGKKVMTDDSDKMTDEEVEAYLDNIHKQGVYDCMQAIGNECFNNENHETVIASFRSDESLDHADTWLIGKLVDTEPEGWNGERVPEEFIRH